MATTTNERRQSAKRLLRTLKGELNEAQLETLASLEKFGWELKFVRRPPFQPSVAVVTDGERKSLGVLEPDGTLNESPDLALRDD
ncbi:MAG: hypothetical protein M3Q42_06895 [Pseudomonadota bacterium]|nr:hypothetical protein [Pseudomonadota bacterium]